MNFMTSHKIGDTAYIPFWTVLEYYDITPPDPFIKCQITNLYKRPMRRTQETIEVDLCDLSMGKDGLNAYEIPTTYLISKSELSDWSLKIANWFTSFKPAD